MFEFQGQYLSKNVTPFDIEIMMCKMQIHRGKLGEIGKKDKMCPFLISMMKTCGNKYKTEEDILKDTSLTKVTFEFKLSILVFDHYV